MKQVYKKLLLCGLAAVAFLHSQGQTNITQVEYFFDNDPGFGNATAVSVATPAPDITSLAFNANVAPLGNGMHTLFVRSRDANGKWSVTNSLSVAKVQPVFVNPHASVNIVKAEYFYDTDPGFGAGTDIPLTAAGNIPTLVFNANVAALSAGMHTLYVRTKDAAGQWSITNNVVFAKVQGVLANPHALTNVVKAEYFYDSDPGFGNGVNVPVTPATDISSLVFNANVASLSGGMHTLYARTQDAQGKWSIVNSYPFAKVQPLLTNPHTASNIVKVEYFYDTDPGFGNGTDVPVTAALDINGFVFNASVTSLSTGLHSIYVRSRDAQGKWSLTHNIQFSRIQGLNNNPHALTNITKAEYFYDTDPGYGNGTNIPVTPANDISGLVFNADVSTLGNGVHTLYARTRDAQGQWSIVNHFVFAKIQSVAGNPHSLTNINKAEYYYDSDPGFGNGVNIPVAAANDISSLVFNADVTSISGGVHTLYVRTQDAQGNWSVVNNLVFAKVQGLLANPHTIGNVTNIEYFVDTDPGVGNGIPVPITPATDISNAAFNVDMTVLVNAPHHLYVRSKDAQGKWSITNVHSFVGGTAPLAIKLVSFEAQLLKGNKVGLEWITDTEQDVAEYTIERSYDASNWMLVGKTAPLTPNSTERRTYEMTDSKPGTGIVYYRLTEKNLTGVETRAPIRFIKIGEQATSLASVYPNPSDGKQVHISTDMFTKGEVVITLTGADGKVHLQQVVNEPSAKVFTISGLDLAAGNYFINLKGKDRSESLKLQIRGLQP